MIRFILDQVLIAAALVASVVVADAAAGMVWHYLPPWSGG